MVQAGDMCPAPPKHSPPPAVPLSPDDHLIHIDSDYFTADAAGHALASGHVKVSQDARTMSADSMTYDYNTGKATVKGAVDFEDPKLRLKSDDGTYDTLGGADFDRANFQILDRNGRGFARQMAVHPDGKVELEQVRYTTCPVGNQDWMLQASSLNLDTAKQEGAAHGVLMRFKNVPIFYTPYISFPLGDERKSGVLFPSFGHSSSNGYQLEVPYYFNLAPNYDLTLTPGILSARGVQLAEEFRYLTASSHGVIDGTFLPDDKQEHGNRTYFHFNDVTDLAHGLRFDTDITSVSDVNYFSDFTVGSEQTSVTFLERRAEIQYYDDVWRIRGELQNFQTIDSALYDYERPYSSLPRIDAEGLWRIFNSNLEFAMNSEAVNFVRKNIDDVFFIDPGSNQLAPLPTPTGVRVDVSPELRWSERGAGYFFEPAVGYHFTQYDLQNAGAGLPSTPTRTLPYARLDAGLIFERNAGSNGQRTQTLEPRVVYSYVPYRNQNELPVFDTAVPDLNLTELFRTNRFVGDDRISDADQVAIGLTTRLFDTVSGAQYLSATIGQIRYVSIPRVTIPEESLLLTTYPPTPANYNLPNPLASPQLFLPNVRAQGPPIMPGQLYVTSTGQLAVAQIGQIGLLSEQYPASDIVSEVALTAYKHVTVNLDYQWNPYTSHTDKEEIGVQWHPDSTKVLNLSYRFQTGILKQYDGSFVWPIAGHWNTIGRWVYSLQDHETIEQVTGIEYKSCCYRIQIVQRRYLERASDSTATTRLSSSIALQLELTGLSSVGKPADSFLQKEIPGYPVSDSKAGNSSNSVP
ncbi:MAG: LPS-assembly protein LptD [Steroidobacteraceae bacterium]